MDFIIKSINKHQININLMIKKGKTNLYLQVPCSFYSSHSKYKDVYTNRPRKSNDGSKSYHCL